MTGEELYDAYREERIAQGWQEFLWKSLSQTQQLVWTRLAERIVRGPGPQPVRRAEPIPFVKPTRG